MKLNLKGNSEKIVWRMIQVWFGGVVYGGALVLAEYIASLIVALNGNSYTTVTVHLPEYLIYIGVPVSSGIVTGLVKNALENKEKIRQNPDYLKQNYGGDHI